MNYPGFSPVIGQQQVKELLTQSIIQDRIAPAYLFVGNNGVGKKLAAQCFTQILLGVDKSSTPRNHPDLLWIEPTYLHQGELLTSEEAEKINLTRKTAPIIRLEQIRQISTFLSKSPWESSRQLVILQSVETMAEPAANALLKTLEEPGNATFILIAPSVESVLNTIVSRCQRIPFYPLHTEDLIKVLQQTGHHEILENHAIMHMAYGSPGNAIAYYNHLQSLPEGLLDILLKPTTSYLDAFLKAGRIAKHLNMQTQLWLIDYLQHFYWKTRRETAKMESLEQARKRLLSHSQPRLVWECTFMNMLSST